MQQNVTFYNHSLAVTPYDPCTQGCLSLFRLLFGKSFYINGHTNHVKQIKYCQYSTCTMYMQTA